MEIGISGTGGISRRQWVKHRGCVGGGALSKVPRDTSLLENIHAGRYCIIYFYLSPIVITSGAERGYIEDGGRFPGGGNVNLF